MFTKNSKVKCDHCGKFIGFRDSYYNKANHRVLYDVDGGAVDVDEIYEDYHQTCLLDLFHQYYDTMENANESLEENTARQDAFFAQYSSHVYDPFELKKNLEENIAFYEEESLINEDISSRKVYKKVVRQSKALLKKVNQDIRNMS